MDAVETIRKVLSAGLLKKSLLYIPSGGASHESITNAEGKLRRQFSAPHRNLLTIWNGLDLEVVRLHGVAPIELQVIEILKAQELLVGSRLQESGAVAFASDPSGFAYVENTDGSVCSWDADGGQLVSIARSIDEFFGEYVFGRRGAEFAGNDWLNDLKRVGIT